MSDCQGKCGRINLDLLLYNESLLQSYRETGLCAMCGSGAEYQHGIYYNKRCMNERIPLKEFLPEEIPLRNTLKQMNYHKTHPELYNAATGGLLRKYKRAKASVDDHDEFSATKGAVLREDCGESFGESYGGEESYGVESFDVGESFGEESFDVGESVGESFGDIGETESVGEGDEDFDDDEASEIDEEEEEMNYETDEISEEDSYVPTMNKQQEKTMTTLCLLCRLPSPTVIHHACAIKPCNWKS
uniref:Uncharacterized protein n=1 Tax=viral metagenome TaxID=1070528 RepID=A0A6C0IXA4_9ZZZZ